MDKLKGQCHEIFCLKFFSRIIFPQPQRYRRQICHRCPRRRWQIATGINNTGGKFATGVNDTGSKQWEQYQTVDNLK